MWHSLWSADNVARLQLEQLIANLYRKGAFDDEEGIVLLVMKCKGGTCRWVMVASIKSKRPSTSAPVIRNNHESGPIMTVFFPSPFLMISGEVISYLLS